ncbi:hypothetical protein OTU49_009545, partial [Cherax quadricarinatus]
DQNRGYGEGLPVPDARAFEIQQWRRTLVSNALQCPTQDDPLVIFCAFVQNLAAGGGIEAPLYPHKNPHGPYGPVPTVIHVCQKCSVMVGVHSPPSLPPLLLS